VKENDEMAKKTGKRKGTRTAKKQALRSFDVYLQSDGALVVLLAGNEPDVDMEPVWSGEAVDEKDAVAEARHANKKLRKAATAVPAHDPNTPSRLREDVERETNERLGITSTRPKSRAGRTKRAKTGTRTKVAARKSSVKRASTRRRG
jgi:hypothetical protein